MSGNDDLWHSRHTNNISTERKKKSALRSSLIGWSGKEGVDSLVELSVWAGEGELLVGEMSSFSELQIVGIRERWESWAELVYVGTAERVRTGEAWHVDVLVVRLVHDFCHPQSARLGTYIVEQANIPNSVVLVESTGSIGDNNSLDTQQLEDTDWEGNSLNRMSLEETATQLESSWAVEFLVTTYCTLPTIKTTGVFDSPNNPNTNFPA